VDGLRVNRTKVQAKNRAFARCAQPFSMPPSEHDTQPSPGRNPGMNGSFSDPPDYRRHLIARGGTQ
jgi:hypothetical protein